MADELRAVEDISFHIGGATYKLDADYGEITPREAVYLLQLAIALLSQHRIGELAVADFVERRRLWHFFRKIG